MTGTVLGGARGTMETVHTTDTQAALCFLAVVCGVERKVVFIGLDVYMKSAGLKGSFPVY